MSKCITKCRRSPIASLIFIASLACLSMLYPAEVAAENTLRAYVDKTRLSLNEQLVFIIELSSDSMSLPDPQLPDLSDFQVVGRYPSTSFNFINGRASSSKTIKLAMFPLKTGKITIGSVRASFKGQTLSTEPITIEVYQVGQARQQPQGQSRQKLHGEQRARTSRSDPVFAEAKVSKNRVYQDEPFRYSILFYTVADRNLGLRDVNLEMPSFSGFSRHQLPERKYYKTINGTNYYVQELRFLLSRQVPGSMEIEPTIFHLVIGGFNSLLDRFFDDPMFDDPWFGFGKRNRRQPPEQRRVMTDAVKIDVLPLPEAGKPVAFQGAVGEYSIDVKVDKNEAKAGMPITLTVSIKGRGNLNNLPQYKLPALQGFRIYEPERKEDINIGLDGISGRVAFEYIIIPQQEGTCQVPSMKLHYFDPARERYMVSSSNPISITVLPGEMIETPPMPQITIADNKPLKVLGKDIRYIKTEINKARQRTGYIYQSIFYLVALMLPVPLIPICLLIRKRQDRLAADKGYRRRAMAPKVLRKRLAEARRMLKKEADNGFYGACSRALTGYIGDRLNIEAAGMTMENLKKVLIENNAPEKLAQEIIETLEEADFRRFSASIDEIEQKQEFLKRTKKIISHISRLNLEKKI